MTEAEWRSTTDLHALRDLCEPITARKARLYAAACLGSEGNAWGASAPMRDALEVAVRYADGWATTGELLDHYDRLQRDIFARRHGNPWDSLLVLLDPLTPSRLIVTNIVGTAVEFWGQKSFSADLMREVFGNPFRWPAFDRAWRTTDVNLLAKGIYEEKAFDRMPILADALQDAGCDSDELLSHLRDTSATHVRGCWALDLVLGKE